MDSICADIAEKKEIHAKAHYSITVLKWRKSISQIHFFHKIEKKYCCAEPLETDYCIDRVT